MSSIPRPLAETILLKASIFIIVVSLVSCNKTTETASEGHAKVDQWMTTGDRSKQFEKIESVSFDHDVHQTTVIAVDTTKRFQAIDGFGYALTGGSAWLLHEKVEPTKRQVLLQELFGTNDSQIGISYLRLSIGASDLDAKVFSYHDAKDPELKGFNLSVDTLHLLPILKEILAINPDIKIMGSPWTAPSWMKTNNHPKGGSLKPEFYESYARYFVKYVEAMKREGITVDAITLQNEPENPGNTPSMLMTAEEQANFVKNNLGPAFEKASLKTKIVIFDHNCDHPIYPITTMNDRDAKKYIDGSAFHLYLGKIEALDTVHAVHPDKNIYFTEQWTSGKGDFGGDLVWHTKNLIVGATRHWSRNVLEWNLAADPEFNPHTGDGGCTLCQGALTIGDSVLRNVSYYIIAHASKFVRPGSVRIESNQVDGLNNVAFITPNGKKVLIVVNDTNASKEFAIKFADHFAPITLPAGAVGTYVWE